MKIAIGVFIGGPLTALVLWYSIAFLPYLRDLKSLSVRGHKSVESIENVLYPLAVVGETTEGLRSYAISQAYWSLVYELNSRRTLVYNASEMLWFGASYVHFSEQEIFGFWGECALSQCESGLQSVARKYFDKALTDLSERELAGLVAIVRSPSVDAPGTVRGEQRTDEILEKAKTHNPVRHRIAATLGFC